MCWELKWGPQAYEAGALPLLAISSALFALAVFVIESHFMPRLAWTMVLLFVILCIAGVTEVRHNIQPLVEMRSREHFAGASLLP
jgi:hypothetical protein